jgi:hypothetical protein
VGGTATADVDGARLRRAVGSNWLSNGAIACPGDRIGDCLLDTVFRKIAQTYFIRASSEPAQSRTIPQQEPLDMEKVRAAAAEYGVEILGPPPGTQPRS